MRKLILTLIILILIVGCSNILPKTTENGVPVGEKDRFVKQVPPEFEVYSEVTVHMKDGEFDQPVVRIKKGGSVTWKNDDIRPYLFIIYYNDVDEKGNVKIEKTSTGRIDEGQEFSHTFEKAGDYKLVPIEYGKLRGLVKVE